MMGDIDPRLLGQRIRQIRQTKGKSQTQLGRHLGRTHAAVSYIERGKTNLTVQDLTKIASFLDVSVNNILNGVDGNTANRRGWWKLTVENIEDDTYLELSDSDLGHIAELIQQGYTEGEIVKDVGSKITGE